MSGSKGKMLELMREEHLCVLSTVGPDGQPQSAVVGFAQDSNGNLVIGTSNESRKYENIKRNPRVSLVIGWDNRKTIQYEGLAHETNGSEKDDAQKLHVAKHPANIRFKDVPNNAYIMIEPTWVRYTDASSSPWLIEEVGLG